MIASTGEQVTIGLLAMALQNLGVPARSYTGTQVRVLTDNAFTKARIKEIDSHRIMADLNDGKVVIVAGFKAVMKRATSQRSAVAVPTLPLLPWQLLFMQTNALSSPTSTVFTQLIRAWSATLANWMLWRLRNFGNGLLGSRFFRSAVWNLPVNTAFRPACSQPDRP